MEHQEPEDSPKLMCTPLDLDCGGEPEEREAVRCSRTEGQPRISSLEMLARKVGPLSSVGLIREREPQSMSK